MRAPRQSAIRVLQLMMVASVVLPAVLFAWASWLNYRHEYVIADERIERSLDILHEHTLKVFQTVEGAFAEVDEIMRGMPDEAIRSDQSRLHDRLKRIVGVLPQLRAIFLVDRDGKPLVSSQFAQVPADLNASDRNFFSVHAADDAGTYVSDVISPQLANFGTPFSSFPGVARRSTAPSTASPWSPCCRSISRNSTRSSAAAPAACTRSCARTAVSRALPAARRPPAQPRSRQRPAQGDHARLGTGHLHHPALCARRRRTAGRISQARRVSGFRGGGYRRLGDPRRVARDHGEPSGVWLAGDLLPSADHRHCLQRTRRRFRGRAPNPRKKRCDRPSVWRRSDS